MSTGDERLARRHALRAGWTRVLLCLLGLAPGAWLMPELGRHRPLFVGYLVLALIQQLLIRKGIGGEARAIAGGVIDIGVLTFLVHRLGSVSTVLVSLYVVLGMMEALVHPRRVALSLAALASLGYGGMLFAEATHLVAYAPDATPWAAPVPPDLRMVALGTMLMSVLMVASTVVVSDLVHTVRAREEELLRVNDQLAELSLRDPLTQLYNRRHLMTCIDRELGRARRGHPLALLMLDLDGFKKVNDEQGHLQGDDLLQRIAQKLESTTRVSDVAGRYGGDEFAVVLPDTDEEQARRVASRLVAAVREAGDAGHGLSVTASVGVALARPDDEARSLQRRADEAAYRAKQQGGDRAC